MILQPLAASYNSGCWTAVRLESGESYKPPTPRLVLSKANSGILFSDKVDIRTLQRAVEWRAIVCGFSVYTPDKWTIQLLITHCVMLLTMEVVIVVTYLSDVYLYLFVLVRLLFISPNFHKWYLLSSVCVLWHTVGKSHSFNYLSSHKLIVSWNNLVWLRKVWNSLF